MKLSEDSPALKSGLWGFSVHPMAMSHQANRANSMNLIHMKLILCMELLLEAATLSGLEFGHALKV